MGAGKIALTRGNIGGTLAHLAARRNSAHRFSTSSRLAAGNALTFAVRPGRGLRREDHRANDYPTSPCRLISSPRRPRSPDEPRRPVASTSRCSASARDQHTAARSALHTNPWRDCLGGASIRGPHKHVRCMAACSTARGSPLHRRRVPGLGARREHVRARRPRRYDVPSRYSPHCIPCPPHQMGLSTKDGSTPSSRTRGGGGESSAR